MKSGQDSRTLSGAIYQSLRDKILTGTLLPGQRLKVSQLADDHGVSLNVVREALSRLTGEQLVEIEPQYGFTVRALSAEDLVDLFQQRIVFESIALQHSIANGDVEWQSQVVAAHHRLSRTPLSCTGQPEQLNPEWLTRHEEFNFVMMEACGSQRLLQIVRQLAEAASIYQRALLPAVSRTTERESEHSELLEAILSRNAECAIRVLTMHLEQTLDMMLPVLLDQHAIAASANATEEVNPRAKSGRRLVTKATPAKTLRSVASRRRP